MSAHAPQQGQGVTKSLTAQLWWVLACLLPLGLVALSVLLGQDAHWDLRNYHLHNPWMVLNERLDKDLAAAGVHTYFNPTLDIPYYWLIHHLPARGVSIVMGVWHATTFLMLLWLARIVIPTDHRWVHLAVALAGCLGSTFLTEVGNDMGDNSTAPFVLGGLALALGARQVRALFVGALLVGLAVGLKLTNGPYLIGICAAVVVGHEDWRRRMTAGGIAVVGSLVGTAVSGGWWYWLMWRRFQNPLFPQFNSLFKSTYASNIRVVETRFALHGVWEGLLLPYTQLVNRYRISEAGLAELLWAIVYTVAFAAILQDLRIGIDPRRRGAARMPLPARQALTFLAFSYLGWLLVFVIGRYAVVMECLLPLALVVLLRHLGVTRYVAVSAVLIAASVAMSAARPGGWQHSRGPAPSNFDVEPAPIQDPDTATVILLDGGVSWVLASLPPQALFMSRTIFPESEAYRALARAKIAQRGGRVYALLDPHPSPPRNRMLESDVVSLFKTEGFQLRPDSCRTLRAKIGSTDFGYELCELETSGRPP